MRQKRTVKPAPPKMLWHVWVYNYATGEQTQFSRRARDFQTALARAERKACSLCSATRCVSIVSNGYLVGTRGQDPMYGVHLCEQPDTTDAA